MTKSTAPFLPGQEPGASINCWAPASLLTCGCPYLWSWRHSSGCPRTYCRIQWLACYRRASFAANPPETTKSELANCSGLLCCYSEAASPRSRPDSNLGCFTCRICSVSARFGDLCYPFDYPSSPSDTETSWPLHRFVYSTDWWNLCLYCPRYGWAGSATQSCPDRTRPPRSYCPLSPSSRRASLSNDETDCPVSSESIEYYFDSSAAW